MFVVNALRDGFWPKQPDKGDRMKYKFADGFESPPKRLRYAQASFVFGVLFVFAVLNTGCERPAPTSFNAATGVAITPVKVVAQGKLLPKTGVIQVAAIPGDRIEQVKVRAGDTVKVGDVLVVLASESIRRDELSIGEQKLAEAKSQLYAKRKEADLQVSSAEIQVSQAKLQIEQAEKSLDAAERQSTQLSEAKDQVDRLVKLTTDPKTRGMVGSIDADQKRIELDQTQSRFEQVVLAAEQAVALARFGLEAAERKQQLAIESRSLVDTLIPMGSLEKQIDLLRKQIEMSRVLAPTSGFILTVNADAGEMVAQMPLLEMADLSEMVCIAEVSDASIRFLEVGHPANLESAALSKPLHGVVERIDRIVGSPQMKVPNPLAKTDFRAVPVWIAIDKEDMEAAAKLVQLHVDVTMEIMPKVSSTGKVVTE